jgi:hypothetical protein
MFVHMYICTYVLVEMENNFLLQKVLFLTDRQFTQNNVGISVLHKFTFFLTQAGFEPGSSFPRFDDHCPTLPGHP